MPNPKNTFSAHILSTETEQMDAAPKPPIVKPTPPVRIQSMAKFESKQPDIQVAEEPKARMDYRKTRADKEGKKYINILIDKDLQSELKPRMVTRNLTWESLVEGLLQRWLEENPGYKP